MKKRNDNTDFLTKVAGGQFIPPKGDDLISDIINEIYARLKDDSDAPEGNGGFSSTTMMMPYADMMSLLLIFFVFFFITSNKKSIETIKKQNQAIVNKTLIDSLRRRNEQVISIQGEFLFESGKARLKDSSLKKLHAIAKEIKEITKNEPGWQIRIEGHTDNVPIKNKQYSSNWELSTARAVSIVKFFMENNYFPPNEMQAMGYGEFNPLVPNDIQENRRKNRRVEIRLCKFFK